MRKNIKIQEHKRTDNSCIYAILICAIMAAGCAQSTKGRLTVESSAPLGVKVQDGTLHVSTRHPMVEQNSNISMVGLMEVAEDVLTGMHFTIEKADVRSGLIRTRPLPGAQFFEFWRSDNVGADNTFAANLQTIRRTVTLDISRQNMELRIGCEAHAQRLSLPERQVSSSAGVYGMFSTSSPSLQRLQLNPEQKKDMEWIDMGRDPQLEAEILKRIKTQIAQRTNHRLQTTENET
jgi:hypothetical protein